MTEIHEAFYQAKNELDYLPNELPDLINSLEAYVPLAGGRRFRRQGEEESISMGEILQIIAKGSKPSLLTIRALQNLNERGNEALKHAPKMQKILTYAKSYFTKLFSHDSEIINSLTPKILIKEDVEKLTSDFIKFGKIDPNGATLRLIDQLNGLSKFLYSKGAFTHPKDLPLYTVEKQSRNQYGYLDTEKVPLELDVFFSGIFKTCSLEQLNLLLSLPNSRSPWELNDLLKDSLTRYLQTQTTVEKEPFARYQQDEDRQIALTKQRTADFTNAVNQYQEVASREGSLNTQDAAAPWIKILKDHQYDDNALEEMLRITNYNPAVLSKILIEVNKPNLTKTLLPKLKADRKTYLSVVSSLYLSTITTHTDFKMSSIGLQKDEVPLFFIHITAQFKTRIAEAIANKENPSELKTEARRLLLYFAKMTFDEKFRSDTGIVADPKYAKFAMIDSIRALMNYSPSVASDATLRLFNYLYEEDRDLFYSIADRGPYFSRLKELPTDANHKEMFRNKIHERGNTLETVLDNALKGVSPAKQKEFHQLLNNKILNGGEEIYPNFYLALYCNDKKIWKTTEGGSEDQVMLKMSEMIIPEMNMYFAFDLSSNYIPFALAKLGDPLEVTKYVVDSLNDENMDEDEYDEQIFNNFESLIHIYNSMSAIQRKKYFPGIGLERSDISKLGIFKISKNTANEMQSLR